MLPEPGDQLPPLQVQGLLLLPRAACATARAAALSAASAPRLAAGRAAAHAAANAAVGAVAVRTARKLSERVPARLAVRSLPWLVRQQPGRQLPPLQVPCMWLLPRAALAALAAAAFTAAAAARITACRAHAAGATPAAAAAAAIHAASAVSERVPARLAIRGLPRLVLPEPRDQLPALQMQGLLLLPRAAVAALGAAADAAASGIPTGRS